VTSGMKVVRKKLESLAYPCEMCMILRSLVLTQYQRVTDRQPMPLSHSVVAECDNSIFLLTSDIA